ncbi:hypothetical protein VFPFJ_03965 [Purpureocillium lilacinum]|uniref:Uncharacterized protein n=1 Tax=Purpureocillium lilacinum TaxID=33203 RepID=A0A179HP63_PURLI|nr:hypothetical protein VFPFJ_03965 [Purpureocillium lilacinum]OAQ92225.1 hypothetical protein VFPFJ_03965 [Purpureocillium lilacinum]
MLRPVPPCAFPNPHGAAVPPSRPFHPIHLISSSSHPSVIPLLRLRPRLCPRPRPAIRSPPPPSPSSLSCPRLASSPIHPDTPFASTPLRPTTLDSRDGRRTTAHHLAGPIDLRRHQRTTRRSGWPAAAASSRRRPHRTDSRQPSPAQPSPAPASVPWPLPTDLGQPSPRPPRPAQRHPEQDPARAASTLPD